MRRWISVGSSILFLGVLVACTSAPREAANTTTPTRAPSPTAIVRPPASTTPTPVTLGRSPSAATAPSAAVPSTRIAADGRLSFVDHKKLTFRTNGTVSRMNVKELDQVAKGRVLAKLDTTPLEQAVKTADLGLKTAQLAFKTAEADRKQAEDTLKSVAIDLEMASDNYRKTTYPYTYKTFAVDVPMAIVALIEAERQVEKSSAAMKAGPGSPGYNDAAQQLSLARENLTLARQRLSLGQGPEVFGEFASGGTSPLAAKDFWTVRAAQLQMDKSQVAVENARTAVSKAQVALDKAKNDVDKANNELDKAKDDLDKATIIAPFDGIVARVGVKEGDFLYSGNYATTVAIEFVDPKRMELVVRINELDVPSLKLGQKVTVRVDALSGERIESTIASIGSLPVSESGTVQYDVTIAVAVPKDSRMKAGMGATADITGDPRSNVPPAPSSQP